MAPCGSTAECLFGIALLIVASPLGVVVIFGGILGMVALHRLPSNRWRK